MDRTERCGANVMEAWTEGQVQHIDPSKVKVKEPRWPVIEPGPERVKKLLNMWIAGLPDEMKTALKFFLE